MPRHFKDEGTEKRKSSDVIDSLGDAGLESHDKSSSDLSPLEPKQCHSIGSNIPVSKLETTQCDAVLNLKPQSDVEPSHSTTEKDLSFQQPTTSRREIKETLAPVSEDSYKYNMSHKKRGVAVIFNHETFQNKNITKREGTKHDVNSLEILFRTLGFEVRIFHDRTFQQIYNTITELSQEDHKEHDCLSITFLTHGLRSNDIYAYDHSYNYSFIFNQFSGENCLSLAGKPKLFFFQVCRGDVMDGGLRLCHGIQIDSGGTPYVSYTIPNMSDFLAAYSSFDGYCSWRTAEKGSWFIQSLTKELMKHHEQDDLITMIVRVTCAVATKYETYDPSNSSSTGYKQVPCFVSSLTRKIYFEPKASLISHD